MAGSFTDFLENEVLDQLFGAQAYTAPTPIFIGLATSVSEAGVITGEPSGNNYARVSVTNNKTTWSTAASGALSNAIAITFNEATGSWGTVSVFFISDSSTGNSNTLAYGDLSSSKTIDSGDTPKFNIGDLDITLD